MKHISKTMSELKEKMIESAERTAVTEVLLPGEAGGIDVEDDSDGKTYKLSQETIRDAIDVNARKNIFDFQLPHFGSYAIDYTRNGRFNLIVY